MTVGAGFLDERGIGLADEADWTAFHEVDEALSHLHWLVYRRWRRQRRVSAQPPVAKEVEDALRDLRPLLREARGIWGRLARYRPGAESESQGEGRVQ